MIRGRQAYGAADNALHGPPLGAGRLALDVSPCRQDCSIERYPQRPGILGHGHDDTRHAVPDRYLDHLAVYLDRDPVPDPWQALLLVHEMPE